MASMTEKLSDAARNHPVSKQSVPLEAAMSLPIPGCVGSIKFLRFLFYSVTRVQGETKSKIHRPFARLAVTYPDGKLVEYLDFRITADGGERLGEPIGEYPHAGIAKLSFAEAEAKNAELYTRYDGIMALYPRTDLTAAEKMAVAKFKHLFDEVAEPALTPFYHTLNPEFFQWLERMSV